MHGAVALEVGKREGGLAVAAVRRAEEREQRGVLRQRHELAVAQAQPLGAKLNGKMRISATNGSAMTASYVGRREDAEQRDDEVDAEVTAAGSCAAGCLRLARPMSLPAPPSACPRRRGPQPSTGPGRCSPGLTAWRSPVVASSGWPWAGIWLTVRVISSAPPVSARMKPLPWWIGIRLRRSGKRERRLAVAAVGRADQLEEGLVLGDRQQLAVAEHPSGGGEVAREHPDLTDIGLCHRRVLQFGLGKMPCRAMQKLRVRNGCMLRWAWLPPVLVTVAGLSEVRAPGGAYNWLGDVRQQVPGGDRRVTGRGRRLQHMGVGRQLRDAQRVRLLAASLAQRVAAADVDRHAAAQVGQREVHPPVAAERRARAARRAPGSG